MACIDVETPARAEARLRAIMRSAKIEILREPYAWEEISLEAFPNAISEDAVAVTRIGDGWSQLVPADPGAWTLFCLHFGSGANADGFVEWFAANLRSRVGPRLMNVSGFSPRNGTIGYWAVPWSLREPAIRELTILTSTPVTGVRAVGLL